MPGKMAFGMPVAFRRAVSATIDAPALWRQPIYFDGDDEMPMRR